MLEKKSPLSEIALVENVVRYSAMVEAVIHRTPGLPGIGIFHGKSGYGKTRSQISAAHTFDAYYVEIKSVWTIKDFFNALFIEVFGVGYPRPKTTAGMLKEIGDDLAETQRPVMIDEFNYWVDDKKKVYAIMDLYEASQGAAVILTGEEMLPQYLERYERIHNRIHTWLAVEPASENDCQTLLPYYCPGITLERDLIDAIYQETGAVTRRICVDFDRARQHCENEGLTSLNLAQWKAAGLVFSTGKAAKKKGAE